MVQLESELIPIISGARHQLKGGKGVAVEVSSGYGIADLVFFEFNQKVVDQRVRNGINPIDGGNLLRIIIELQKYSKNETISITSLRRVTSSIKEEMITYLIDNNFLIREAGSSKSFRKGLDYENGLKDVVAIEAKLKDWKRGLYQAYRYRSYADRSYLAVYTKYINAPLKNMEQFRKYNVGLIEVGEDGVKVHFEPKKEASSDKFMKAVAYENLLRIHKGIFPGNKEVSGLVSASI